MYETLIRPFDVFQPPTMLPLKSIREKLQVSEQAKEDRRLHQIAQSRAKKDALNAPGSQPSEPHPKRKREDEESLPPKKSRATPTPSTMIVTQPIKEVRGHTSYLTFATLLPSNIPEPNPTPKSDAPKSEPEPAPAISVVQEPEQEEMMVDEEVADSGLNTES